VTDFDYESHAKDVTINARYLRYLDVFAEEVIDILADPKAKLRLSPLEVLCFESSTYAPAERKGGYDT